MMPEALPGKLALYQTEPVALPYFETNGHHANKLVFLAGLTDTIGVVPYLPPLAHALDKIGYALVQPVKGSDLGGFGTSSLEGDAQEMAQLIEHLTTRADDQCTGTLVIMGHSTGCQDVVAFLSKDRRASKHQDASLLRVHGGILQAPASDHDYFEANKTPSDEALLHQSEAAIQAGRGYALLPRDNAQAQPAAHNGRGDGNADAVLQPAFTAYRYQSLHGANGDDDYFSYGMSDDQIRAALSPALSRAPLLMLVGEKEYVRGLTQRIRAAFDRQTPAYGALPHASGPGRTGCAACS